MRLPARPFHHTLVAAGAALALFGVARAEAATWSSLQPAAHARAEGAFVVHDGGAFHVNGFDGQLRIENSIERYDIATDAWQTVSETTDAPGFPTAITHSGTVVVDGEAWFIGGRIGASPGAVTDGVIVFDLDTSAWRAGPTLPVPFAGGGAAVIGRRIHLFGGIDAEGRCDVDTHLVYDLDAPGDGWRDLGASAPFPSPRNHFATVVMGGLVYTMGGQIGHDDCSALARQRVQTRTVHVYDPAANGWKQLADMPWPQSHAEPSSFAHAGRIWSVGGMVQGDRVLSYDPATNEWTWRDDLSLPTALLAPGARIFQGNRLHVFGGGAPDVFDPQVNTYVTDVPGLAYDASADVAQPVKPVKPVKPVEPVEPTEPDDVDEPDGGGAETPVPVDETPVEEPAVPVTDEDAGPSGGDVDTPVSPVAPVVPGAPVMTDGLEEPGGDVDGASPDEEGEAAGDADTPSSERPATGSKRGSGGGAAGWLFLLLALPAGARRAVREASRRRT